MNATARISARVFSPIFLSLTLLSSAWAAPTNTVFSPTVQLSGSTLQLNGKGTRHRAVFKVYEMALYLPRKTKSADEVLSQVGPKQIDFTAMRELDTTEVGLALVKGMRANATPEQTRKYLLASNQLIEVFSARRKLMPGDKFGLQHTPGKGTIFLLNGVPQNEPLSNDEFFGMMLKIWVGESPAEPLLKDALLDNDITK